MTDSPHLVNDVRLEPADVVTDSLSGRVEPEEIVNIEISLGVELVLAVAHWSWYPLVILSRLARRLVPLAAGSSCENALEVKFVWNVVYGAVPFS